jgi:hypothetical protein
VTVDLANYTAEQLESLRGLMTPEEQAEFDLLLMPSLEAIEADWRLWLRTLFPHLVRGELSFFQIEYMEWLWSALWAKRRSLPLPDGENAFLSVWSRGAAKSSFARIAPIAEAALLGQGYCLYISGNQDQANKHLGSIETLLTSDKVRFYYPQLAAPQIRNTDRGSNKAWNQKMLHLKIGYVIQAIGLDVGIRGANIDDMRISLEVPDDIDERDDTILQSEQKMDKFLHSVLPAKKAGTLFICAQNLVIESGVINRIVTGEVPALANARISGPHPRVLNLKTERREVNGRQRDIVLEPCEVTWPGNDSIERVQEDIDTYTLPVFKRECQHELQVDRTGLVLSPWDDAIHVITEEEFEAVFHYKGIPSHWNKEILHDWAQSKSAYHANVVMKLAVSSQNEPLPGCIFLYDPMSFAENTQSDDVAIRILESIAPTIEVNGALRTWKEILDAEFGRLNLEKFVSSATTLIAARREILAHVIPPLVGPLLRRHNYRRLRMSHEAKDQRNVYRRVYGLPFTGVNPRREGGIEFACHYLRVYPERRHPFRNINGWSQMYVIVPKEKKNYPVALRPDSLHDHDLLRYQFSHWRHSEPHLTTTGIIEHGPEKMNDDFGNALQMGMLNGGLLAEPLSYNEQVEEMIAPELRLQTLLKPSAASLMGRRTMTAAEQLSYHIARERAQQQITSPAQQFDEYGDLI